MVPFSFQNLSLGQCLALSNRDVSTTFGEEFAALITAPAKSSQAVVLSDSLSKEGKSTVVQGVCLLPRCQQGIVNAGVKQNI